MYLYKCSIYLFNYSFNISPQTDVTLSHFKIIFNSYPSLLLQITHKKLNLIFVEIINKLKYLI